MNPNITTSRFFSRIGGLKEIVIIGFIILRNILFLSFEMLTFFRILVIRWISFLKQRVMNMNRGSFQGSSFHITKRTWDINTRRTKCSTYLTDPTIGGNLRQPNTSLMKTDITHGAKNYEVIFCIVPICADLALCIFNLHFPLLLLQHLFTMQAF
jgi:hypothetical protein